MRKNIIAFLSMFTVLALSIGLSSCKKDDEPPPVKPKLSFASPTLAVKEADGTVKVEVTLDNPTPEDIVITYTLAGTAKNKASVTANQAFDYEILSEAGEIEILKGGTTGIIDLMLTSDYFLEDPETIEIKIGDVDSQNIEITREDEILITLDQEDGLLIGLSWPPPTADSVADLDILVRKGKTSAAWEGFVTGSIQENNAPPEFVFIPKTINDVAFGLSYVYYDGTMNQLPFTVLFIDYINGDFEPESGYQSYKGVYKLANRNKWTDPTTAKVVQTFKKSGGNPVEISTIAVPTSGSRVASSGNLTSTLQKQNTKTVLPERLLVLLKKLNNN